MQEVIDILEKPLVWPEVKAIAGGLVAIEPSKNQIIDALKSRMAQAADKLREAQKKSTPECRKNCEVYENWLKLEARNAELQSDIDKLREAPLKRKDKYQNP